MRRRPRIRRISAEIATQANNLVREKSIDLGKRQDSWAEMMDFITTKNTSRCISILISIVMQLSLSPKVHRQIVGPDKTCS